MNMNPQQAWKNFNLGEELSISGNFIYNGLRCFHEMQVLDNVDEVFEFLYSLSVGIERLLKIVVVLIEHKNTTNQAALEKSLITHNHLELLKRVTKVSEINLGAPHHEFLSILSKFYKSIRYDRFRLSSIYNTDREQIALRGFLEKYLDVDLSNPSGLFAIPNDDRYRKFIRKTVIKISSAMYQIVNAKAHELEIFTYELRHGSKAETIFLGNADIPSEEILIKELLVFFMNTRSKSGHLDFLRSIQPLDFDPEEAVDYLQCFLLDAPKALVIEELNSLYDEFEDPGERLQKISLIANPNVYFDNDLDH